MAIQLCPVDTANVHPRNILGSSSSFDRERLSPFGSLSSRWPSLVANPARKGTLSSIARTPPAVASPLCQNRGPAKDNPMNDGRRYSIWSPQLSLFYDYVSS